MGIVPMHLRKMALKYWGMVSSLNGPLWLPSVGHHGLGVPSEMAGKYFYVGIKYILRRNPMGGSNNNLIIY